MRVGLIGSVDGSANTCFLSTRDLLKVTTENLGNLLFRYSMQTMIGDYIPIDFAMNPRDFRNEVDIVVYPTANQINPNLKHLEFHARFFEQLARPLIVVGLGAQFPSTRTQDRNLQPSTVRYLKTISAFSNMIGVRGEFSQSVLNDLGISNSVVMGCPSNFLSPQGSGDLAHIIESRLRAMKEGKRQAVKIGIHPQSGNSYYNPRHLESERFLYGLAQETRGGSYIVNGPAPLYSLARNRLFEAAYKPELQSLHDFLDPNSPYAQFIDRFRAPAISFTSLQGWMEHLSCMDIVVGKRIHGSIAAIQCNTPSILLSHDSRTEELAGELGIPSVSIDDPHLDWSKPSLNSILARVQFDPLTFARKRDQLWERFQSLFSFHGIPLKGAAPSATA